MGEDTGWRAVRWVSTLGGGRSGGRGHWVEGGQVGEDTGWRAVRWVRTLCGGWSGG